MSNYRQQQEQQEHQEWLAMAQQQGLIFCPYCYRQLADKQVMCCHELHGGTIDEIGKENFL